ncbi:MAG TPA: c-type cytochrome [Pseudomonadales bacterium]
MALLRPTVLAILFGVACLVPAGAARAADAVARGEYLVNLLGCGRCHTEGYLLGGQPTGPHLAGSRVGIAYTDAEPGSTPGLAFAPNLTPDEETGIGTWSRRDIERALTTGVGTDGHRRLPVMPWANYSAMHSADVRAISAYLKSLPPVRRAIPRSTAPGEPVEHPYVRFGVYVFMPFDQHDQDKQPEGAKRPL